jgi:hypothetical protein
MENVRSKKTLMVRKNFFALIFLFVLSSLAFAQTSGSIRGVVTDTDNKPIPGAMITINSTALIGQTRVAYTNELGVFRFPSLSPGTYFVEATMESFETVKVPNIEVSLQFTAVVPIQMKFKMKSESITVVGETPLVDVTDSGFSTSYKNELLQEVPTQRNMTDLMQLAPGISPAIGDSYIDRAVAFGSNVQSNFWNIDGLDISSPQSGSLQWSINPDLIQEIQVIGVGAPAEYGNHLGAVVNVVTKKGGNQYHGGASYYYQDDALTGTNVEIDPNTLWCGTGCNTFHRVKYNNFSSQLGGPILKDRLSFFGGFASLRDARTNPGEDPDFVATQTNEKYDVKLNGTFGAKHEVNGFFHYESWRSPWQMPAYELSALPDEHGSNPSWGAAWTSRVSENFLLDLSYAGWQSDSKRESRTGSLEDPVLTKPSGSVITYYSGGVQDPSDHLIWKNQIRGKATYYAENFLNSQHEFRFGIQYSYGSLLENYGIGPNGIFTYDVNGNSYRSYQDPFQKGGINNDLGFFVDDTITVNQKLTLNLGVRFDHNAGHMQEFEILAIGQPSVSSVGNFAKTGQTTSQVDVINWNLVSPRLGFVYQLREDNRSILQGSFGVYYDHDVSGNWDDPAPGVTTLSRSLFNSNVGLAYIPVGDPITKEDLSINPDLKAPRTLQYSMGYEQQVGQSMAFGAQYVYKTTKDLIGWEILGGDYKPKLFFDPITGKQYTLLNIIDNPLLRKGNDPGNFPGSENLNFFQKYHGLIFTFDKRFSNRWSVAASYTLSRSTGLLPRMLFQGQNPEFSFFPLPEGKDPNNYINAEGLLQNDRPHMFRVMSYFQKLPLGLNASVNTDFSSGKHHVRTAGVFLNQGGVQVIMQRGYRIGAIKMIDLNIGRRFDLSSDFVMRVDATIFNLLNNDNVLGLTSQELVPPQTEFSAFNWTQPRRLQLRLGFEF